MDWESRLEEARAKRAAVLAEREKLEAGQADHPDDTAGQDNDHHEDAPWALDPVERAKLFQGAMMSPLSTERSESPVNRAAPKPKAKGSDHDTFALRIASDLSKHTETAATEAAPDHFAFINLPTDEDRATSEVPEEPPAPVSPVLAAAETLPRQQPKRTGFGRVGLAFCAGIAVGGAVVAAQFFLPAGEPEPTLVASAVSAPEVDIAQAAPPIVVEQRLPPQPVWDVSMAGIPAAPTLPSDATVFPRSVTPIRLSTLAPLGSVPDPSQTVLGPLARAETPVERVEIILSLPVTATPDTPTAVRIADLGWVSTPAPEQALAARLNTVDPTMRPQVEDTTPALPTPSLSATLDALPRPAGFAVEPATRIAALWPVSQSAVAFQISREPAPDGRPQQVEETLPQIDAADFMRLRVLARLRGEG